MTARTQDRRTGTVRARGVMAVAVAVGLLSSMAVVAGGDKAAAASPLELYVSVQGADGNDGSESAPFATLEAARDAIRARKATGALPAGGVIVNLREGEFARDASFHLEQQDSGTASAPIVYRAQPGEQVSLVGGVRLDGAQFGGVQDPAVLDRLQPSVRDRVQEYDLSAHGTLDYGENVQVGFGWPGVHHNPSAELFVDAEPFRLARWPDTGFVQIGETDPQQSTSSTSFGYVDPRPESWADLSDVWMYGFMRWDWADGNLRLDGVDTGAKRITSNQITPFSEVKTGQRYYYYNVLEELDAPGEWYLDRATNKLYAYLSDTRSPSDMTIRLSTLNEPIVRLDQVSHVSVEGLTIEDGRDSGIAITGGDRVTISGNVFRNLGNRAMTVEGGEGHTIVGNEISQTGYGGIFLSGGDRTTLTPSMHTVVNNTIHDYSRVQATYTPAVEARGVGHTVAHNEIYNGPHTAIWLHGNNHVVEYNDIHDVVTSSNDAGAIYAGSDWTEQGTVIRYNYLHNIRGDAGTSEPEHIGIYMDDQASGSVIYGNVIEYVNDAMRLGGGHNQTVVNNLLIDSGDSVLFDDRGTTWQPGLCAPGGGLQAKLQAVPYGDEPWASRYTYLPRLAVDATPCVPKNNVLQDNVFYKTRDRGVDPHIEQYGYVHTNWLTLQNPGFVDESSKDFSLVPSPLVTSKLPRFEPVPFDRIGVLANAQDYLQDTTLSSVRLISSTMLRAGDSIQPFVMAEAGSGRLLDLFGKVGFTSSNPAVATVHPSNGTVTAVATGTVTIGVTGVKDGVTVSSSLPVEVVDDQLSSVALQLDRQPLIGGQTAQALVTGTLTDNAPADLTPAMVSYASSDPQIAEITPDGVVTAKQPGVVDITVKVILLGVTQTSTLTLTLAEPVQPPGSPGGATGAPDPVVSVRPSSEALTETNRGGLVLPETVVAGERFTAKIPRGAAGATVVGWLFSAPRELGDAMLGAGGGAVFTMPADTQPGEHRVAVTSRDGAVIAWGATTVIRSEAAAHERLPATGGTVVGVGLAVLLLVTGAVVTIARRRCSTTA